MASFHRIATPFLAGCVLSFGISDTVFAVSGAPLAFDQFQVGDTGTTETAGKVAGEITADCVAPSGIIGATITCGEPTISNGMLQRKVTVAGSGDSAYDGTYVQFILTEPNAEGDATANPYSAARGSLFFTNEDFIKMNNRGEGLATKQTILDASFDASTQIEERFKNTVTFNMGWANGSGTTDPWVNILQETTELRYDNADPTLATSAKELLNETVSIISDGATLDNTKVEIDQRMTLENDTLNDAVQKFKHTRLSGGYTKNSYPNTPQNNEPILPGGTNNGNVNWIAGDAIVANWIGYELNDPTIHQIFGVTEFENLSAPVNTSNSNLPNKSKRVSFLDPEAGGPDLSGYNAAATIHNSYAPNYTSSPYYIFFGANSVPILPNGWNGIVNDDSNGVPSTDPVFGYAEAMADVTTYSSADLTAYTSTGPSTYEHLTPIVVGSPGYTAQDNLDYLANSSATPPSATSNPFQPVDADYNNWTVSNGIFTLTSCPGDACGTPAINEDGMFQRLVIVNGETYYQTILVGGAVTGDPNNADFTTGSLGFVSETFVKAGAGSGIGARTHLAEQSGYNPDYTGGYLGSNTSQSLPADSGDFVQDVALNKGWANQGSVFNPETGNTEPHATMALTQDVFVPDYGVTNTVPMRGHFTMERGATQADKRIAMTSEIGTTESNNYDAFIQPIQFRNVTVSGAYQQTASADYGDPFAPDVTWVAGDALQATWIAGSYGVNPLIGLANLNTVSISNRTQGTSVTATDVDTTVASGSSPAFWYQDPFLTAPSYP